MTTEAVLAAATDILERDGLLGLSMRKLAAELGVSTSTVYWHVGTRDELLDKLIEQITDELGRVRPKGKDPVERIGSMIRSLLNEVRARPQLISLSSPWPTSSRRPGSTARTPPSPCPPSCSILEDSSYWSTRCPTTIGSAG
jgi:AcrR family transcriptional regulator